MYTFLILGEISNPKQTGHFSQFKLATTRNFVWFEVCSRVPFVDSGRVVSSEHADKVMRLMRTRILRALRLTEMTPWP